MAASCAGGTAMRRRRKVLQLGLVSGREVELRTNHGLGLAAAALLTACTIHIKREENAIVSYMAARQNLLTCGTAVYADARFALITAHIPFNPNSTSLTQLNDEHFATKQEITLLFAFDRAFAVCPNALVGQLQADFPTMAIVLADGYTKGEYDIADLIEQRLTWGTYAKVRKDGYFEAVQHLTDELQRVRTGLSQSNDAESARQQAAVRAISRLHRAQQIINDMSRAERRM
jgi:hypothetical protein